MAEQLSSFLVGQEAGKVTLKVCSLSHFFDFTQAPRPWSAHLQSPSDSVSNQVDSES